MAGVMPNLLLPTQSKSIMPIFQYQITELCDVYAAQGYEQLAKNHC